LSRGRKVIASPEDEGYASRYSEEFTKESFRELHRLAFWARSMGPAFYLIGGWAAWRFHQGLGSRDIDVVFMDRQIGDAFLGSYCVQNGYELHGNMLCKRFKKRVVVGDMTVYVEIDAAAMAERCQFKRDRNKRLPYSLMRNHSLAWDIRGESVLTPTSELLLLQKVKALSDRTWELEHEVLSPLDSAYIMSKIWKDRYDISSLAPLVGDWGRSGGLRRRAGAGSWWKRPWGGSGCRRAEDARQTVDSLGIELPRPIDADRVVT